MKKTISRVIKACETLIMASFFFGCSMMMDEMGNGGASSSSVQDIRSMMNRSDAERLLYMGGSVLYSPKDSNANQLIEGAVVATRIGKVIKKDLGCGEYAYQNSKTDFELGFIAVDSISKSEISFTYYKFPSADSNKYVSAGSFTLAEGETADLNGDGIPDVMFRKPDAGRKGYKSNMWLTFLCDVEAGDSAAMFSIVPMQYSRSVYPNGLLGINTTGQYVINKYDVGTNNRSVVSNISYGDYVLDTEANSIARYVGAGRNSRSAARAINDGDVQELEQISTDSKAEDFEFKANEFTDDFDVNALLAVMPSSIVTEAYSGHSLAENTAYLNRLIREPSFLNKLVAENSSEAADEIRSQLHKAPLSSEIERVIFCRHALSLVYPEYCPDVNLFSQSLSNVLPWLYIDFGELVQQPTEAEETAARCVIIPKLNNPTLTGPGELGFKSEMEKYMAEAENKHKKERETKVDAYVDYEVKRDAIEKYFSQFYSYNFAPLLATLPGQQWLKDIVKGTKTDLSVGIGGGISFANGDPSVNLKMGVLIKFELENRIAFNVSSTSFFASSAPEKKSIGELKDRFNEKFPDGHYSAEEIKDYLDTMSKMDLKDELGLDSWVFDASETLQKASYKNGLRPSKDAKSLHKRVNPVPSLPLVLTFDARFDILFKTAAVVELDNLTVGGIYMTVFDCKTGINWGFREKILGVPVLNTFYCDTYAGAERYSENAGFAGITSKDPKLFKAGGGVKFTIAPVVEFRIGGGLGYDILGAGADVTLGAKVDFFAPFSSYVGLAYTIMQDPVIILDMDMDAGFSYSGDVQFCLDPPILSTKYWNYDIPGLKDQCVWQIFRLRMENYEIVKAEGPKKKA